MNKLQWLEQRFDAIMLTMLSLAFPVIGYELCGLGGLVVGLGYALTVGDAIPPRFNAFVERQPAWRVFLAVTLIASLVVVAAGENAEAIADNTTLAVFVLAIQEGAKRFTRRRQQRQPSIEP